MDFSAADASGDAAIVNERFVQVALGGAAPIGVRIGLSPPGAPRDAPAQWRTIVGVMPTIRQQGAAGGDQQSPAVYLPIAATAPPTAILMMRHTLDPALLLTVVAVACFMPLRRAVRMNPVTALHHH